LVQAAKNTDGIIGDDNKNNHAPFVLLKRFDNYAAVYELTAYTNKPNQYLKIQSEIRKKVYDLFQINGLNLVIPQAQVNIDNAKEEKEDEKSKVPS
jgi:small-conductance mechanosensitive channel